MKPAGQNGWAGFLFRDLSLSFETGKLASSITVASVAVSMADRSGLQR
jgi:hypothetical protein